MKFSSLTVKVASLALPQLALGATDSNYQITKEFNFKDDFFLKICPLGNAIGPDNVDLLMSALEEYGAQFMEEWKYQVREDLQDGACTVDAISSPEFSICDWRYPDQYDVTELPTPGQSYIAEACFVQRVYYHFSELTITCPEDFTYDDLNRDNYTGAAFAGDQFTITLTNQCEEAEAECLFSTADSVEVVSTDSENAELFVSRFVDLPVYLKCLEIDGYGPSTANMLIKALDEYFEMYIEDALTEEILSRVPDAHVYGYASPYKSERHYCAHGPYYADGNLVNQVRDTDGILVTKFTYGFDIIWFKPLQCDADMLFPDITTVINDVFVDEDFLLFLQTKYPELDFVQDTALCNVVDPKSIQVTISPTEAPSPFPTYLSENGESCSLDSQCTSGYCHAENGICSCRIENNNGCSVDQVCRHSCAYLAKEPRCYDDELVRDCEIQWGEGYVCADGNEDGTVDIFDKNSGCNWLPPTDAPVMMIDTMEPTSSPLPKIQTMSPTPYPSLVLQTIPPTILTASNATPSPTDMLSGNSSVGASGNQTTMPSILFETNAPTPVPTFWLQTNPPSVPAVQETPVPTPALTGGNSETLAAQKTMPPTMFEEAITESPVTTLDPTSAPTDDGNNIKCDQKCVVYPDDTEPDECPIATVGTCGGGDRGDGICSFEGYCCSPWGWCGTGAEYCTDGTDGSTVPTPSSVEGAPVSPTISIDAGMCGNGNSGEGTCAESSDCCSEWGYCGSGENYCYTTRTVKTDGTGDDAEPIGTCGGGGVGNGICNDGLCCSRFGFCGEGAEYCSGVNDITVTDALPATTDDLPNGTEIDFEFVEQVQQSLPDNLKPDYGFRCGFSEVDARSNCKSKCTHHNQCEDGEECWGIQLNYCNTFEEGTHPICTNLDMADNNNRCGYDETSARGHCGPKCSSDLECGIGEFCYPTLLNLCECIDVEVPEESKIVFAQAKSLLTPYFVEKDPSNADPSTTDPSTADPSNVIEGLPNSSSSITVTLKMSAFLGLLIASVCVW